MKVHVLPCYQYNKTTYLYLYIIYQCIIMNSLASTTNRLQKLLCKKSIDIPSASVGMQFYLTKLLWFTFKVGLALHTAIILPSLVSKGHQCWLNVEFRRGWVPDYGKWKFFLKIFFLSRNFENIRNIKIVEYHLLQNYRVLKGEVSKRRGCSWGTLRIPAGKIGVP